MEVTCFKTDVKSILKLYIITLVYCLHTCACFILNKSIIYKFFSITYYSGLTKNYGNSLCRPTGE